MKKKYPRYFIRADNQPFAGKLKSLSYATINKAKDITIFQFENNKVPYSEKECDNLVRLGIWKEIEAAEVILL